MLNSPSHEFSMCFRKKRVQRYKKKVNSEQQTVKKFNFSDFLFFFLAKL